MHGQLTTDNRQPNMTTTTYGTPVPRVISLARRADRREAFAERMDGLMPFHWADGVEHESPMVGCNWAHKAVIRAAKEAGQPCVWVMEDDAFWVSRGAYAHYLRQWPADFDLYLGGAYGYGDKLDGTVSWFGGTHCYVMAASLYDAALALPDTLHWDQALSSLSGRFVLCTPFACMQTNGHSDSTGKYERYGEWGVEKWYRG